MRERNGEERGELREMADDEGQQSNVMIVDAKKKDLYIE